MQSRVAQRELAGTVLDVVEGVSSRLRLAYAEGARDAPYGFIALATLRHLQHRGPQTVGELARKDKVSTQAVSVRVAPLIEAGHVSRTSDPEDRRRSVLAITEAGQRVIREASRNVSAHLATAIGLLSDDEQQVLMEALPVLRRLAECIDLSEKSTTS